MRIIKPKEMYIGMKVTWYETRKRVSTIFEIGKEYLYINYKCAGDDYCCGHNYRLPRDTDQLSANEHTIFLNNPTSNKGLVSCVRCGSPTEKRRDFSDMSIREFCPRCKI